MSIVLPVGANPETIQTQNPGVSPAINADPVHPLLNQPLAAVMPALPPLGEADLFLPVPQEEIRLVIRLSERRVYVYKQDQLVASYPIAIGRQGWETPTGSFQVLQMQRDPVWEHPFTGELVPPGPANPLGARWIGFWTDGTNYIGFHGTPNAETVGQAASHGCIRMYDQDVIALFEIVEIGTPVSVVP
jgi:lipoprotein-anchoring transpeptidase ErfK/SrfK